MNKYTYYTIPCIHNTMNPTATAAQTARPPMLVPRITPDGLSYLSYIARATVYACIGTNEHGCVTSIG